MVSGNWFWLGTVEPDGLNTVYKDVSKSTQRHEVTPHTLFSHFEDMK